MRPGVSPCELILVGMEKVQHDDLRVLQPQLRLPGVVLLGEFLNPKRRLHADRIRLADREWNIRDPAAFPIRVHAPTYCGQPEFLFDTVYPQLVVPPICIDRPSPGRALGTTWPRPSVRVQVPRVDLGAVLTTRKELVSTSRLSDIEADPRIRARD